MSKIRKPTIRIGAKSTTITERSSSCGVTTTVTRNSNTGKTRTTTRTTTGAGTTSRKW